MSAPETVIVIQAPAGAWEEFKAEAAAVARWVVAIWAVAQAWALAVM